MTGAYLTQKFDNRLTHFGCAAIPGYDALHEDRAAQNFEIAQGGLTKRGMGAIVVGRDRQAIGVYPGTADRGRGLNMVPAAPATSIERVAPPASFAAPLAIQVQNIPIASHATQHGEAQWTLLATAGGLNL